MSIKRLSFIFLFIIFLSGLSMAEAPAMKNTVSDYTGWISSSVKEKVRNLAEELKKVSSVNLKVLVVCALPDQTAEAFGREVYDAWDVGQKKEGLDHGVLLIISCVDRRVKIIVGKALEDILTPKIRNQFEWNVMAALSKGQFSEGVQLGSTAISHLIVMEWQGKTPREFVDWRSISFPILILLLVSAFLPRFLGANSLMTFGIFIGGIFGYLFFGLFGMFLGGVLGFVLNWVGKK